MQPTNTSNTSWEIFDTSKCTKWSDFKKNNSAIRSTLAKALGYKVKIGDVEICLDGNSRQVIRDFLKRVNYDYRGPLHFTFFVKRALESYLEASQKNIKITRTEPTGQTATTSQGKAAPGKAEETPQPTTGQAPEEPTKTPPSTTPPTKAQTLTTSPLIVPAETLTKTLHEAGLTTAQATTVVNNLPAKNGTVNASQDELLTQLEPFENRLRTDNPEIRQEVEELQAVVHEHKTAQVAADTGISQPELKRLPGKPKSARARKITDETVKEHVKTAKAHLAFMKLAETASPLSYAEVAKVREEALANLHSIDFRGAEEGIKRFATNYRELGRGTPQDTLNHINKCFTDIEAKWKTAFSAFEKYEKDPKVLASYKSQFDNLEKVHKKTTAWLQTEISKNEEAARIAQDQQEAQKLAGPKKSWREIATEAKDLPAPTPTPEVQKQPKKKSPVSKLPTPQQEIGVQKAKAKVETKKEVVAERAVSAEDSKTTKIREALSSLSKATPHTPNEFLAHLGRLKALLKDLSKVKSNQKELLNTLKVELNRVAAEMQEVALSTLLSDEKTRTLTKELDGAKVHLAKADAIDARIEKLDKGIAILEKYAGKVEETLTTFEAAIETRRLEEIATKEREAKKAHQQEEQEKILATMKETEKRKPGELRNVRAAINSVILELKGNPDNWSKFTAWFGWDTSRQQLLLRILDEKKHDIDQVRRDAYQVKELIEESFGEKSVPIEIRNSVKNLDKGLRALGENEEKYIQDAREQEVRNELRHFIAMLGEKRDYLQNLTTSDKASFSAIEKGLENNSLTAEDLVTLFKGEPIGNIAEASSSRKNNGIRSLMPKAMLTPDQSKWPEDIRTRYNRITSMLSNMIHNTARK